MRDFPEERVFLRVRILQKPCFVTSSCFFLLAFIVLLQNKHTTLAENGENLIIAQPQISAHLEQAPTLISRSKNLITAQNWNFCPIPWSWLFGIPHSRCILSILNLDPFLIKILKTNAKSKKTHWGPSLLLWYWTTWSLPSWFPASRFLDIKMQWTPNKTWFQF